MHIKLKRRKENVAYENDDRVITAMSILKSNMIMEETFLDKGILEKLTRERKSLAFHTAINKAETLNKP
jgi:hypothetical protein